MTAYLGKTPRGPKFKKISSKGTSQWKSKTKRALRSTMRKHAKKSPRAKSFAAAVQRGIRMSKELNPMSPETWARRFALATGYAPYRKRTKTGRKTKRRRGPTPGTAAWAKKVVKGVKGGGRSKYHRRTSTQKSAKKYEKGLIAAMKREFPSLKRAMNPRKRRKSKRRKGRRMNRYPMISARALVPYKKQKKSKRRRNKGTYRRNRMKNPVADSLRSMISTEALTKYAYATGGVAVGGVFPALVSRFIWKGAQRSQMTESLVGLGGTILAGITVNYATKDQQKGMLVVAGGLAGVVGNILVNQLSKVMGISGFGQSAEDALKMAVEQEMERAGLSGGGMGQFLVPGEAEQVEGLGQFLTEPEMESAVATTQGMGDIAREDLVDSGSAAFAGIDGSMF